MYDRRAHALPVPLGTDSVAPHRLVTGRLGVSGGSETDAAVLDTALFFDIDEGGRSGRVTFQGLDSVRTSRGESLPYELGDDFSSWVYVVENSRWLAERHDYEWTHYETAMLESHQHYVFAFHDDFVEALAEGIWLDVPDGDPLLMGDDHPLAGMPASAPRETGSTAGLSWEVACSGRSGDQLFDDARLCAQPLFAFNLLLDGTRSVDAGAWLRVRAGVATSTFAQSWPGGEMASFRGIAEPQDFLGAWEVYCAEVAGRRRGMGK